MPSIARLKENKKPVRNFKREFLENLAKVKIGERLVRSGWVIFLHQRWVYTDKRLIGKMVELWETLKGLEVGYNEKVFDIMPDYWERIKNS